MIYGGRLIPLPIGCSKSEYIRYIETSMGFGQKRHASYRQGSVDIKERLAEQGIGVSPIDGYPNLR
ncbi:hypothetical protein J43TS9_38570 [Paenibacillus cineris]|nr:hypothetical protein J43TS9_38570 [Paenibacillus cineris]